MCDSPSEAFQKAGDEMLKSQLTRIITDAKIISVSLVAKENSLFPDAFVKVVPQEVRERWERLAIMAWREDHPED